MNNIAASAAADKLIENISGVIVNPLIVLMFTFALVAFLWGVRAYITGADNPEVRAKGANGILWGIIGMALMFMAFTIVKISINTFGLGQDTQTKEDMKKVLKPTR
ncbi:MAG: hypothetical protein JWP09_620 [Candidatus Taylorbacteria bacterium]|nr:hypothetical protein [Candidatus Taylorbacteria bacterium]